MSPPPHPPPPSANPAPSFSYPSLITTRVHSYTWYTRVSQNNFLRQNIWHSSFFENLSKPPFFCRFASAHFLQHLLPKLLSFFHCSTTRESFRIFPCYNFFHPYLTNANYLCRRIFGTSLFNPSRQASGFTRERVEGGGEQITSPLPQFYCSLSPNS